MRRNDSSRGYSPEPVEEYDPALPLQPVRAMRLLDQNEHWFPRARGVGDVEAPEGWTDEAWASVVALDVDASGAWMLADVYGASEGGLRGRSAVA
jgi:hypothetical protein